MWSDRLLDLGTDFLVGNMVFVGEWGVSLTRSVLESVSSFGAWGVSLTRPEMEAVCSFRGW